MALNGDFGGASCEVTRLREDAVHYVGFFDAGEFGVETAKNGYRRSVWHFGAKRDRLNLIVPDVSGAFEHTRRYHQPLGILYGHITGPGEVVVQRE